MMAFDSENTVTAGLCCMPYSLSSLFVKKTKKTKEDLEENKEKILTKNTKATSRHHDRRSEQKGENNGIDFGPTALDGHKSPNLNKPLPHKPENELAKRRGVIIDRPLSGLSTCESNEDTEERTTCQARALAKLEQKRRSLPPLFRRLGINLKNTDAFHGRAYSGNASGSGSSYDDDETAVKTFEGYESEVTSPVSSIRFTRNSAASDFN